MKKEIEQIFKGKETILQYQYPGMENPYKIHFKPKAEIKIAININRNVIKLINPALLDLDEKYLKQIQLQHNQQYRLEIFGKFNQFSLFVLHSALEYLQEITIPEVLELEQIYQLLKTTTSVVQRDLHKQAICIAIVGVLQEKMLNFELNVYHIEWLLNYLNPYNAVNVTLVLNILTSAAYQNKKSLQLIIDGLQKLSDKAKFRFSVQPLFKVVEVQKNINVVYLGLEFLNNLLDAAEQLEDEQSKNLILDQYDTNGLYVIIQDIKHKCDEYKMEDCTFQSTLQYISQEKYSAHYNIVEIYYLSRVDDIDLEKDKDLRLKISKIDEIFSQADRQFQIQRNQLRDIIEQLELKLPQPEQDNAGPMLRFSSQFRMRTDEQPKINEPPNRFSEQNMMTQSVRHSYQPSAQDKIYTEIYKNIRNAKSIDDINKDLLKLCEEQGNISTLSKLFENLAKKLQEIQQQDQKGKQILQDIIQGLKGQNSDLQLEIKSYEDKQKKYLQNETQSSIITELRQKLKAISEENMQMREKIKEIDQFKEKAIHIAKKVEENQGLLYKIQQIKDMELKIQQQDQEIQQFKREIEQLKQRGYVKQQSIEKPSSPVPPPPPPPPPGKLQPPNAPLPPPPPPQAPQLAPPPPPPPGALRPPGPPPPPPPGAPQMINGIGAPPLPGAKKVPQKPKQKPNVAMRGFQWNLVKPDQVNNTVFQGMDETAIQLDKAILEEKFAAKQQQQVQQNQESESKPKTKQKVSLLAPERIKNFELILSKLKMSNSLICRSILECNTSVLRLNVIESLLNIVPTDAEFQLYNNQEELDKETLQSPDLFVIEASSIPCFADRLITMKASFVIIEQCVELKNKMIRFRQIYDFQLQDDGLKFLIKLVLAYGNYINGESVRGGAFGFRLDAINKAADMKTNDGKMTLLMIIAEKSEDLYGKKLVNEEIFDDLEFMSKSPLSQLYQDLKEIEKTHKSIKAALKSQTTNPLDMIIMYDQLNQELSEKIDELKEIHQTNEKKYEELCLYYCENPKQMQSDAFFQLILNIWKNYTKAKSTVDRIKLLESKEKERSQYVKQRSTIQYKPVQLEQLGLRGSLAEPFGRQRTNTSQQIK